MTNKRHLCLLLNLVVAMSSAIDTKTLTKNVYFSGEIEMVKHLIDKGANVNLIDRNGNTALILASKHGNYIFFNIFSYFDRLK